MRTATYSKPLLEKLEERRLLAATLQSLGDLPGGAFDSMATGVSADGSVVVGNSDSGLGSFGEAFRWTAVGGMVGLGDLPGGDFYSGATGVSADGSVVVGATYSSRGHEPFRWTADGGMVALGDTGASYATGVSADGSVVVGYGYAASGYIDGFRWTAGGGLVSLSGGGHEIDIWTTAVSGDGSVVVGSFGFADPWGFEAYRWTADEGFGVLDDPRGGGFMDYATGVSSDGSVVVGTTGSKAVRWTAGVGFVELGNGWAYGVSADGAVVVGAGDFDSRFEAVRWTTGGGMQRLWDLLLTQGVDPAAGGWSSLTEATAVSADGNAIVGYGTRNGNQEAFVAVVPVVPTTKTYVGPNGGNWSTASNWSPSGVPTSSDLVDIAGKSVNLSSSATVAALTLSGGATLTLEANGNRVLRTSSSSISSDSKLNLNDNALIVDYSGGSPLESIRAAVQSGYAGGAWNGNGITSSAAASTPGTGIGLAEASNLFGSFPATFAEQSVDDTSVLLCYTLLGDANLDQKVNIADLGILATNWQQSPRRWAQGDFNYDGTVDITDLGILATKWQVNLPALASRPGTSPRAARLVNEIGELFDFSS